MRSEAPADGNGHADRVGDHDLRRVPEVRKVGRSVSNFWWGYILGALTVELLVAAAAGALPPW